MEINNTNVTNLAQSVAASGYPMQTEISREIDEKDFKRAEKLANFDPGTGHNSFLKGINVQTDVTAPQYWWLQFGRYHFADIISSQSKMHRITKMNIREQCNDYVDHRVIDVLEDLIKKYNRVDNSQTIKKLMFQRVVATSPMGLQLTARITTNYLQLKSMYNQRRNHKLEEWQLFCDWIEDLPYSELITGQEEYS